MKHKISPKEGAAICAATIAITQLILNLIGINNKTVGIFVTLVTIVCIGFAVSMIKNADKLGKKFSIAISIFILLCCIFSGGLLIMTECFSQFGNEHKILEMTLLFSAIGTFFLFIILLIVALDISINKKR